MDPSRSSDSVPTRRCAPDLDEPPSPSRAHTEPDHSEAVYAK
ncbi:hypothetical protein EV190_11221 [Actinorugispora endophytica]|uniref:Uncharacterized protein n=1 Tax=Actinorugispora endophytica TaxID=1605990 RepID=A0A4R6UWR9_9ACTN|nr:hypothetical protein EV190_11221 [Actinorugispora endophytica]